jgi:hypothetical protein
MRAVKTCTTLQRREGEARKKQGPPARTVQAENISMILGTILAITVTQEPKESKKYALVGKAHPPNNSNSGSLKVSVSLNEQQSDQGRPYHPRVCLAFFSLVDSALHDGTLQACLSSLVVTDSATGSVVDIYHINVCGSRLVFNQFSYYLASVAPLL